MKVLAIDPGYDRIGVAILGRTSGTDTCLYSSCIITDRSADFAHRLQHIGNTIETLLQEHQPDTLAIETLFFNKNVKTAIGVAHARGVILYLAAAYNCTIFEFGPQEIKVAVTGYGNSDKTAVFAMVRRLLPNIPEHAFDDEYDAIAIGITCLAHHGKGR